MYERFTDRARKVMQLANQEAQRLRREYIDSADILVGLMAEGAGVAAVVLKSFGLNLTKIRREVAKIVQSGPDMATVGKLPQTPRAKKVIEYAMEEARNLNHNYVGTEHLLLGVLREEEGDAAQVLMNLGMKLEEMREEVLGIISSDLEGSERRSHEKRVFVQTPVLDSYSADWTEESRRHRGTPILGREREIAQMTLVLVRHQYSHPLLLGPRGIGKEGIVHGLCQSIVDGQVPPMLRTMRILFPNISALTRGTPTEVESRVSDIIKEAARSKNITLVLDSRAWLRLGENFSSDARTALLAILDAADKKVLHLIVLMTEDELQNDSAFVEALVNSSTIIKVEPPTEDTVREMLEGYRDGWEEHHHVVVTDDAITRAVCLASEHVSGPLTLRIPVDVLDSACAACSAAASKKAEMVVQPLDVEIAQLNERKEQAVANQDFVAASDLRDKADELRSKRQEVLSELEKESPPAVDAGSVERAFGDLVGLPWAQLQAQPQRVFKYGEIYRAQRIARPLAISSESTSVLSAAPGRSEFERLQVQSILQTRISRRAVGKGFVLLPHNEESDAVFDAAIRPAFEENQLEVSKADDIYCPGFILGQVYEQICTVELIVADVSGANPNVIFELGICLGHHRCPIILVRNHEDLPFNLRSLRYIKYENSVSGMRTLRESLSLAIREFLAVSRDRPVSPESNLIELGSEGSNGQAES
jgi:ATP-dependent Clp protease ATP-binding subunit ClpC